MNKVSRKILDAGLSVMEVLLAVGLIMALSPLVYNAINKQTTVVQNIVLAKELKNFEYAITNYISVNKKNLEANKRDIILKDKDEISSTLQSFGLKKDIRAVWMFFQKYRLIIKLDDNDMPMALFALKAKKDFDHKSIAQITTLVGPQCAYFDGNRMIGSTGDWYEKINDYVTGFSVKKGLALKVNYADLSKAHTFVNRVLEDESVLKTNIYMNDNSIYEIGNMNIEYLTVTGAFEVQQKTTLKSLVVDTMDILGQLQTAEDKITIDIENLDVSDTLDMMNIKNKTLNVESYDAGLVGNINVSSSSGIEDVETNSAEINNSEKLSQSTRITGKEIHIADKFDVNADIATPTIRVEEVRDNSGDLVIDNDGNLYVYDISVNTANVSAIQGMKIHDIIDYFEERQEYLEELYNDRCIQMTGQDCDL